MTSRSRKSTASIIPSAIRWAPAAVSLPSTEAGLSILSWLHEAALVRDVDYGVDSGGDRLINVSFDAREAVLKKLAQRVASLAPAGRVKGDPIT